MIQRNGYFSHPENILLAMLGDENRNVRDVALNEILKARKSSLPTVRVFKVPKINMNATNYVEIIDWQNTKITEPLIKFLTLEELQSVVENGLNSELLSKIKKNSMSYAIS